MRPILLFFISLCFVACTDSFNEMDSFSKKTIIVYMAADNDLYSNALKDIEEMLKTDIPNNCNVVVYLDAPAYSTDSLSKISILKNHQLVEIEKVGHTNSASPETLNRVIKKIIKRFPANEYGLILWSHGTGWLPEFAFENYYQKKQNMNAAQNSFGKDNGREMNIIELENALPIKFEYILFDACFMSNIEVLYQLRNKANYIIASPTEELGTGHPYDKILPVLLKSPINYTSIATKYMNFYKIKSGIFQSATIAVISTKELEKLAYLISQANNQKLTNLTIDDNYIQKYQTSNCLFFDFNDVLSNSYDLNLYNPIKKKLSDVILFNDYTEYFINTKINRSCGISVFVFPKDIDDTLYRKYKQLSWVKDTQLMIFN